MKKLSLTLRLGKIAFILARYDALFLLRELRIARTLSCLLKIFTIGTKRNKRPGEKMVEAFSRLGPAFIKLGQTLATRSDLFGEELTADLSILQDRMPPFSGEIAKKIIEKEFKQSLDNLFLEFDANAIAAASIAQVHIARDVGGKKVAVKVLRPNIEKLIAKDLELLMWLAKIAEKRINKRWRPVQAIETLQESTRMEMDLRFEAAAASELAENFKGDDNIKIPEVIWAKTAQRVLTTEWVDGASITDIDAIKTNNLEADKILTKAANIVFCMVLRDGFFHADLHPGNVMVTPDGRIALVDFGITGRLDKKTRYYLAEMMWGFFKRDYYKVAKVHFDAGYVPQGQSLDYFAQACRSIGEPIFGLPQDKISIARLLAQLFKIAGDFQMVLQPQLLLLQKTMMLTEGIGRKLNPNVNVWQLAAPMIEDWGRKNVNLRSILEQRFETFCKHAETLIQAAEKSVSTADSDDQKDLAQLIKLIKNKSWQNQPSSARIIGLGFIGAGIFWFMLTILGLAIL